jgi:hypothetical protein
MKWDLRRDSRRLWHRLGDRLQPANISEILAVEEIVSQDESRWVQSTAKSPDSAIQTKLPFARAAPRAHWANGLLLFRPFSDQSHSPGCVMSLQNLEAAVGRSIVEHDELEVLIFLIKNAVQPLR